MADFATLNDVISLWRALTPEETIKVNTLLPIVSDLLRSKARKVGKNLDEMIAEDSALANVAKEVTVTVIKRYINDNSKDAQSFSQMSESAGGYTVSGTYLVPGGGLFIKNSELSDLGLRRQKMGVLEIWG